MKTHGFHVKTAQVALCTTLARIFRVRMAEAPGVDSLLQALQNNPALLGSLAEQLAKTAATAANEQKPAAPPADSDGEDEEQDEDEEELHTPPRISALTGVPQTPRTSEQFKMWKEKIDAFMSDSTVPSRKWWSPSEKEEITRIVKWSNSEWKALDKEEVRGLAEVFGAGVFFLL